MSPRLRTDLLLLAGVSGFLFFYGLGFFGLVGADEPRYAQVAREMLARRDWITPILGGKAWLEKPPLYYWQAMVFFAFFGVSDWVSRLPSAIDATLMVAAAYWFLKRFRPGSQLDGAVMIAASAGTIGFARAAGTDMPLAATFTIGMLAWYAWRESAAWWHLATFYISIGLATLAKGPVAPFLAALIILIFSAVVRDRRLPFRTLWWPGILMFLGVALPWFIAVQIRNPEFFRVFVLEHNLARFSTNLYRHAQPVWYFIPVTILGLIPWTVISLAALAQTVRVVWSERKNPLRAEDEYNVFLTLWLLLPVVFFSISQSKLPGYILPALPAGGLLLAEYVRRHLENDENVPAWLAACHGLIAAGILVPSLLVGELFVGNRMQWSRNGPLLAVLWLLFATGITVLLTRQRGLRYLHFITLVPVIVAVSALLRIGGPVADLRLSARPVANALPPAESTLMPLAILGVSRETEYGLAFYRNQIIARYERGEVPPAQHLLVAPENSQAAIARFVGERHLTYLGNFHAQHLEFYLVAELPNPP